MFEIILLIFLCNKNATLAEQKNVSKRRWVLTTVFYWLTGELLGIMLLMTIIRVDAETLQAGQGLSKELL